MNRKFKITRIAAYIISIIIVAAVIFSHGTLTPPRIVMAVLAILIGVPAMLLLDKIADKNAYEPALNPASDNRSDDTGILRSGRFSKAHIAIFLIITAIAIAVRIPLYPHKSPDFVMFQGAWFDELAGRGLSALSVRFGNYAPFYSTVFALLAQTGLSAMFVTKFIPIVFDFLMAIVSTFIFHEVSGDTSTPVKRLSVYGVILLNPLTVLNASGWGQCDSLYTTFVLLCLYVLIRCAKGTSVYGGDVAVIFLSVAFALKFQTVLFFPFIFFIWMLQPRKYVRITHAVWLPVIYFATCIPMFIAGRTIEDMLGVYFGQVNTYDGYLTLRYPNFYSITGLLFRETPGYFGKIGMILTAVILIGIFVYMRIKNTELTSHIMLKTAALSVFISVFFLPSMHDRYGYIAEMLILIVAVIDRKYIIPAIVSIAVTLFAYIDYLLYYYELKMPPDIIFAILRLAVIVFMAMDILGGRDEKQQIS